ncbi:uncharacterized protein UHOD_11603 [Ustilago sp. UG-2017b]|nr:uncharacterized protein UHOD_11603 [Ustilago sp. UG-2017b]
MPPKIVNVTQVNSEGAPAETTSDRPVSKPESPIEAGSPSNVRGNKRKLSGLGNPQFKKGKNQSSSDSDLSESSSSESDSDTPKGVEPSKGIDQLSKSTSSLEVRDAAMEPVQTNSASSRSGGNSPTTTKSRGALPPKDPFPEMLDWAEEVEIAEAKKARNETRKAECRDKAARVKQAKLVQLAVDRLAGKPPPRECVRCKPSIGNRTPACQSPTMPPLKRRLQKPCPRVLASTSMMRQILRMLEGP